MTNEIDKFIIIEDALNELITKILNSTLIRDDRKLIGESMKYIIERMGEK